MNAKVMLQLLLAATKTTVPHKFTSRRNHRSLGEPNMVTNRKGRRLYRRGGSLIFSKIGGHSAIPGITQSRRRPQKKKRKEGLWPKTGTLVPVGARNRYSLKASKTKYGVPKYYVPVAGTNPVYRLQSHQVTRLSCYFCAKVTDFGHDNHVVRSACVNDDRACGRREGYWKSRSSIFQAICGGRGEG